jgi:DNA polymerase-3 subunit epsilon
MIRLFFATEATGKADVTADDAAAHQPHLVELGALLVDGHRELARLSMIVKPYGWTIPGEAADVQGITQGGAEIEGLPIARVCNAFRALVFCAHEVIAHDMDTHARMMRIACYRALGAKTPFAGRALICTMHLAAPLCGIPTQEFGYGKWKLPSLAEAHAHFCNRSYDRLHGALSDAMACRRVFEATLANYAKT